MYTTIHFVDIAGLVRGASKGEGLGNQFLSHIREVDAIAHVVRCFDDENVVHVEGRVDPVADVATIDTELCLKDLDTVEQAPRPRAQGSARAAIRSRARGRRVRAPGRAPRRGAARAHRSLADDKERAIVRRAAAPHEQAHLLRRERRRGRRSASSTQNRTIRRFERAREGRRRRVVPICAALEAQIAELEPADRPEFLESAGLDEPGLNAGDPHRLRAARADHVLHGRQAGGARLDDAPGLRPRRRPPA